MQNTNFKCKIQTLNLFHQIAFQYHKKVANKILYNDYKEEKYMQDKKAAIIIPKC